MSDSDARPHTLEELDRELTEGCVCMDPDQHAALDLALTRKDDLKARKEPRHG